MNPTDSAPALRVCILDNDNLDPAVAGTYVSYGAMTETMFAAAGVPWHFERFNTTRGEYPDSFDAYDAVLDAGPTLHGVESTVLDPNQSPMIIYRPGAITADQIRAVAGPVEATVLGIPFGPGVDGMIFIVGLGVEGRLCGFQRPIAGDIFPARNVMTAAVA